VLQDKTCSLRPEDLSVISSRSFVEAALALIHPLDLIVEDFCRRAIDSFQFMNRKKFNIPFVIAAHKCTSSRSSFLLKLLANDRPEFFLVNLSNLRHWEFPD
jgi:hypothetical protein